MQPDLALRGTFTFTHRRETLDTILEIKRRLDGSRVEFTCLACTVRPGRHAAVLYHLDRDWHLPQAGLTVPAGSYSTGFFWETRPFNLYHWMTPEGQTIGDYFNLAAETHISATHIEWLDLVLDLCLVPGHDWLWLDEHELPDGLNPATLRHLENGRDLLGANALRIVRWVQNFSTRQLSDLSHLV